MWCVIGLGVGLDAFVRGYATYGLVGRPRVPHPAPRWSPGPATSAGSSASACCRWSCCCSPTSACPAAPGGREAWLILLVAAALPLPGAVAPGPLQLAPFLTNPIGVTGETLGRLVQAVGPVAFLLFLATIPAAALARALRFRRARGVERQQLKWFATAGLTLVAVPIADTISPFGFDSNRLIELLSTWPLYVAIGIVILRHRLYDIDRLLNRTLVYGLLTVVLGSATAVRCWWPGSCPAASAVIPRAGPSPPPPSRRSPPAAPAAGPRRPDRRAAEGRRSDHGAGPGVAVATPGRRGPRRPRPTTWPATGPARGLRWPTSRRRRAGSPR